MNRCTETTECDDIYWNEWTVKHGRQKYLADFATEYKPLWVLYRKKSQCHEHRARMSCRFG